MLSCHDMSLTCCCHVVVLSLSFRCHVIVVVVMLLPCYCHVVVLLLTCHFHVVVMSLSGSLLYAVNVLRLYLWFSYSSFLTGPDASLWYAANNCDHAYLWNAWEWCFAATRLCPPSCIRIPTVVGTKWPKMMPWRDGQVPGISVGCTKPEGKEMCSSSNLYLGYHCTM